MAARSTRRGTRVAGVLLAVLGACSFDASPIAPVSTLTPIETPEGGSGASHATHDAGGDAGTSDAGTITGSAGGFGLRCGDTTCPVAPEGTSQCCTRARDVDGKTARAADRCGLDLSDVGGRSGCHELEQPGVVDPSCPIGRPVGATVDEQGCCADQGWCGTLDVTRGIGCHHGVGAERRCDEDVDTTVTCDTVGSFAVRAAIDVVWGGRGIGALGDITDDGRGLIDIRLLETVKKVGATNDFVAEVRACQVVLPAFRSSVLCEAYQPLFPDVIWDSPAAPRWDTNGHYQCPNPGCILSFEALTGLIGIELSDAAAPWPMAGTSASLTCASGTGTACYPDHDADGKPGISIELAKGGTLPAKPGATTCTSGYPFRAAPLNANPLAILGGVRRTDRILLGTRVRLGGSGRIADDCNSGTGDGIAEFVESRSAGCFVQEGTADPFGMPAGPDQACNAMEATFLDENLPIYTILRAGATPDAMLKLDDTAPSAGPRFSLRRLGGPGDAVNCADVRAAVF